jgi:hypothetical protein
MQPEQAEMIEQRIWQLFVTGQTDHFVIGADNPDDAS